MRYLIVACLLLTGCSPTMVLHRDAAGRIWKVEGKGGAFKSTLKQADEEVSFDTKQEPWLNFDLNGNKVGG